MKKLRFKHQQPSKLTYNWFVEEKNKHKSCGGFGLVEVARNLTVNKLGPGILGVKIFIIQWACYL